MIQKEQKICEKRLKYKKKPFKNFIEIIPEKKGEYDYITDIIELSNKKIAISSYSQYISIVDSKNFNSIINIEGNRNGILKLLEIKINNTKILIGTSHHMIYLYNIENNYEKINEISENLIGSIISIVYNSNNNLLYIGCDNSLIHILKFNENNLNPNFINSFNSNYNSPIKSLCLFSPENKILFVGTGSGKLIKYNIENNFEKIAFLNFRISHLTQMIQINNNNIAINSWGGSIFIVKINEFIVEYEIIIILNCPVNNFAFFNDNKEIFIACEFGIFVDYDFENKKMISKYYTQNSQRAKRVFINSDKDLFFILGNSRIFKC